MKRVQTTTEKLVEELAAIEHEQWTHWSKAVAAVVSGATRRKWQPNWIPYVDLPDKVKEDDRVWARKTIDRIGKVTGVKL
jgi:hypothetical protein